MGASSSKPSKPSADLSKKLSSKLKEACDHIVVGVFKKHGTFQYHVSLMEFKEEQMTPVRVLRCVEPMKSKESGLGHEHLVVDLRTPEGYQLLIEADKVFVGMGDPEHTAGGLTTVRRIADPPLFLRDLREHPDKVKYDVVLRGSGVILMNDLLTILGSGNPRYSFWKYNCWKYASDTLKKLLERLAELTDTSDDCKEKIREALEGMPSPVLPAEVLKEAACVFLGCCVLGAVAYGGAVAGIGAYNFIKVLIMAEVNQVIGLGGSTLPLFRSAIVAANISLAKPALGVRAIGLSFAILLTGVSVAEGCASMRQNHGYPGP